MVQEFLKDLEKVVNVDAGTACIACLVGVVESVMARLRMHVVPALVGLAGSVAAFVLILTLVR